MSTALRKIQRKLERFYELEATPDVVDFVRLGADDARETLVLREEADALEIALVLPPLPSQPELPESPCDRWMQAVEGVSHFVYVAERARTNLPATLLELELQAEVDKFVLLGLVRGWFAGRSAPAAAATRQLHGQLYENVRYLHTADTEEGLRYRMANDLAARFVARVVARDDVELVLRTLRRFYRAGQAEKIHLAHAA